MSSNNSAEQFVERLDAHRSAEKREQYRRYFKLGSENPTNRKKESR